MKKEEIRKIEIGTLLYGADVMWQFPRDVSSEIDLSESAYNYEGWNCGKLLRVTEMCSDGDIRAAHIIEKDDGSQVEIDEALLKKNDLDSYEII